MSLAADKWEGEWEGHYVRVSRSNLTRGFEMRIDGEKVAGKSVTFLGIGEVNGHYPHGGRDIPVKLELGVANECNAWVDGKFLKMAKVE